MKIRNAFRHLTTFGVVAVGLAAADSARADTLPAGCTIATVDQCKDSAYLKGTCGSAQRTRCDSLLAPVAETTASSLTPTVEVLRPGSLDDTTLASIVPFDMSTSYASGSGSTFLSRYAKYQGQALDSLRSIRMTLSPWDLNGIAVASCEEYAFEVSYEYGVFERQALRQHPDYRAFFNLVAGPTGFWGRGVKNRAGTREYPTGLMLDKLGEVNLPGGAKQALWGRYQNEFFRSLGHIGYNFVVTDPAVAESLQANRGVQFTNDAWAWHGGKSTSLAAFPDESLEAYVAKANAFSDLAARRAALQIEISQNGRYVNCNGTNVPTPYTLVKFGAPSCPVRDRQAEIAALEVDLNTRLTEAMSLGCLAATDTPCDWSPSLFYKELQSSLVQRRDSEFQRCVKYTADNFSIIPTASKSSTDALDTYLYAKAATASSFPRTKEASTGNVVFGQSFGDQQKYGTDGLFELSYAYGAGWTLKGFQGTETDAQCKAEFYAGAFLKVGGDVFNAVQDGWAPGLKATRDIDGDGDKEVDPDADLVDFDTHYTSTKDKVQLVSFLKVFTNDVYDPINESKTTAWTLSKHPKIEKSVGGTKDFPVFGIPITAGGEIVGRVGIDVDAQLDLRATCDGTSIQLFKAGAQVRPWADLKGNAHVGIGWSFLSVGVKGELTFLALEVPSSASARIYGTNMGNLMLEMKANADLKAHSLDGKISLYAEAFTKSVEKTIFEWDGYKTQLNIFKFEPTPITLVSLPTL